MSWFGLATPNAHRFSRHGLSIDCQITALFGNDPAAQIPRGTILIETEIDPATADSLIIGQSIRDSQNRRGIELRHTPGGGISFVQQHGEEVRHAILRAPASDLETGTVRISYSWDRQTARARLAIERPGQSDWTVKGITDPLPLRAGDLEQLMSAPNTLRGRGFMAVGTRVLPLGSGPSLVASTQIGSGFGPRPLDQIKRGDTVMAQDGLSSPVLYPLHGHFPALGSFRPVRLRAPFFGLRQDVVVSPTQTVLLRGSRVEYTYGREEVLVPAGHLIGGPAAQYEPSAPVIAYRQVLMPLAERLTLSGAVFPTPNIGRIRRKPTRLSQSWFAGLPSAGLPEHMPVATPVLTAFESTSLIDDLAA